MSKYNPDQIDAFLEIAKYSHEANRSYYASIGDNSQPRWDDAPEWQQRSALNGVIFHHEHPNAKPSDSHESWLAEKTREGWSFGEVKDPDNKKHPCFVQYHELPEAQKAKDLIFLHCVRAGLEYWRANI